MGEAAYDIEFSPRGEASRIEDYLEPGRKRETLEDKTAEDTRLTYTTLFVWVAQEELNLTRYEANKCLAHVRLKAFEDQVVQSCIRSGSDVKRKITPTYVRSGGLKRVIKHEVVDPKPLEARLRDILRNSKRAQELKNTLPGFIAVADYLKQNHPNLFRRLTEEQVNERATEIGKQLVQEGVIPERDRRLGSTLYYFKRDFEAMKAIDKFISERWVTFYSIVTKVVAEELGLSGEALSNKVITLKRRYVKIPEISKCLSKGKGQLYVRYGTKDRVEAEVRQLVRDSHQTGYKPRIKILYAVWDPDAAYGQADRLTRRTKDRINLEFEVLDLSKEMRRDELVNKMMFERMVVPSFDFIIINLGDDDGQAEEAYFFADACNIKIDGTILVAESGNCYDRRDDAKVYCHEYVTALTNGKPGRNGESFEVLLTKYGVVSGNGGQEFE